MARVDANQAAIVHVLRGLGCTVQPLHTVGAGCPDLLVGFRGRNFLVEIKDGSKPPSERELTPAQKAWHMCWNGSVAIVSDQDEAVSLIRSFINDAK